jgi:hypothetical protein
MKFEIIIFHLTFSRFEVLSNGKDSFGKLFKSASLSSYSIHIIFISSRNDLVEGYNVILVWD